MSRPAKSQRLRPGKNSTPKPTKKTKKPSRRHQPRGLKILHEDDDILVVDKSSGMLSTSSSRSRDQTAYSILSNYVRKGNAKSRKKIYIVHRLDRDTSGILIFAKSEVNKRYLQDKWSKWTKRYFAVIQGQMTESTGVLSSVLAENTLHRMYAIEDPKKGKLAKTKYTVLKESTNYSLVELELITSVRHQIRVHFADAGHPLAGDRDYGEQLKQLKHLALHAGQLNFNHPRTHAQMKFQTDPPYYFETLLKR